MTQCIMTSTGSSIHDTMHKDIYKQFDPKPNPDARPYISTYNIAYSMLQALLEMKSCNPQTSSTPGEEIIKHSLKSLSRNCKYIAESLRQLHNTDTASLITTCAVHCVTLVTVQLMAVYNRHVKHTAMHISLFLRMQYSLIQRRSTVVTYVRKK